MVKWAKFFTNLTKEKYKYTPIKNTREVSKHLYKIRKEKVSFNPPSYQFI